MASKLTLVNSVLRPTAIKYVLGSNVRALSKSTAGNGPAEVSVIRKTAELKDIKTHTGQTFEEGDYRLARFVNREKEVNPRFAIDLIHEEPPIAVEARATFCDGGDGPLGHPRVFINLDQPGNHSCGYCGLRFFQAKGHGHH